MYNIYHVYTNVLAALPPLPRRRLWRLGGRRHAPLAPSPRPPPVAAAEVSLACLPSPFSSLPPSLFSPGFSNPAVRRRRPPGTGSGVPFAGSGRPRGGSRPLRRGWTGSALPRRGPRPATGVWPMVPPSSSRRRCWGLRARALVAPPARSSVPFGGVAGSAVGALRPLSLVDVVGICPRWQLVAVAGPSGATLLHLAGASRRILPRLVGVWLGARPPP